MKQTRLARIKKKFKDLEYGIRILFGSLNKVTKNIVITCLTIMVIVGFIVTVKMRKAILVEQPLPGGTWTEGLIGSPRFINPVLAVSNVDKDLTAVIHAGLLKRLPDDTYVPDLAEKYEVDKNNLVYTFTLKDGLEFSNGYPITTADVLYTIEKIKDPLEKSPRNVEWQGVTANIIDDKTITLTLKQPFNDFLDIVTVGILPKNVYGKYSSDSFAQAKENINAIGAGAYKIKNVKTKKNLIQSITLERTNRNSGYLKKITFKFYDNENDAISALNNSDIDHLGSVSPSNAQKLQNDGYSITLASFPRLYGLFFNIKKQGIMANPKLTEAIASSVDKEMIINSILNGFGNKVDLPLPNSLKNKINYPFEKIDVEKRMTSLGWNKGEDGIWQKKTTVKTVETIERMSFVITTSDTPELRSGAEKISETLKNNGIEATVISFDNATLENKIRTRDYEVLYYGIQVSRESQVYAFWHSSQREHPGLNISGYINSKIDDTLTALQKETDADKRINLWEKFGDEFYKDNPAVFIYSPSYIYVHKEKTLFNLPNSIHTTSDRFININKWYLETEKVLPFLSKTKTN